MCAIPIAHLIGHDEHVWSVWVSYESNRLCMSGSGISENCTPWKVAVFDVYADFLRPLRVSHNIKRYDCAFQGCQQTSQTWIQGCKYLDKNFKRRGLVSHPDFWHTFISAASSTADTAHQLLSNCIHYACVCSQAIARADSNQWWSYKQKTEKVENGQIWGDFSTTLSAAPFIRLAVVGTI